jgi:hypothetical protein
MTDDSASLGAPISNSAYLSLQVSIICLLLFVIGTTAIFERPEWLH